MTEENNSAGHGYWGTMADRYYGQQPPLRISASERDIYIECTQPWLTAATTPRVLVMGATPDFFNLPWPPGTNLLAVDRSAAMLKSVWPGSELQASQQDWTDMDLPDASRDVALCDGGLTFFQPMQALQTLAENLGRIIAPGGAFIVRLFVEAEARETPAEIFAEFVDGKIPNASELKVRLWFALHASDGPGVRLHDVWRCYRDAIPNPGAIASRIPWQPAEWLSMDAYKNADEVYYFPTVDEVTVAFSGQPGGFSRPVVKTPTGPCWQHVKILTFTRSPLMQMI